MIAAVARLAVSEGMSVSAWIRREVEREVRRLGGSVTGYGPSADALHDEVERHDALHAEIARLREDLAEARELGAGWRQERDGHRAHLAGLLASYQQTGIGCVSRKTTVQVIREKLRAGLDVTDKERRMAGG